MDTLGKGWCWGAATAPASLKPQFTLRGRIMRSACHNSRAWKAQGLTIATVGTRQASSVISLNRLGCLFTDIFIVMYFSDHASCSFTFRNYHKNFLCCFVAFVYICNSCIAPLSVLTCTGGQVSMFTTVSNNIKSITFFCI